MTESISHTSFSELASKGILAIGDGHRAKLDELGGDGPYFLRAGALTEQGFDWTDLDAFQQEARSSLRAKMGHVGDVVITTKGNSIGRVGWVPTRAPDFVYSPHLSYWRSLNHSILEPRYLYYWSRSHYFRRQLRSLAFSTDMAPYFSLRDQARLLIDLPPIDDQRAIAEMMGALDDKINANVHTSEVSEGLARAKYSRAIFAGSRVAIRNIAELTTRGITPKYTENEGTLVLNQKCVRNQRINLKPSRTTLESSIRAEKLLQRDDVLVNSTGAGTLGRIARWTHEVRATVDSHISIVRFNRHLVDPVCAGFGLLQIEKEVEALAEGSTGQTELRRDLLVGLEISIPDHTEQRIIGAEISSLDQLNTCLQQESGKLAAVRDDLLPLLMSGKVRVREAEKVVEGVV